LRGGLERRRVERKLWGGFELRRTERDVEARTGRLVAWRHARAEWPKVADK
jgi:hypothetical protein